MNVLRNQRKTQQKNMESRKTKVNINFKLISAFLYPSVYSSLFTICH